MIAEQVPSSTKARNGISLDGQKNTSLFSDIKALFKLIVLVANVLPVFTGFWLALYFSNLSIADHWGVFALTIAGSTLVMGGALVMNNWYDVDIDRLMARTQKRPTVTGTMSLKLVLTIGISVSAIGFVLLLFTTMEAAIYGFIGWFTYVVLYTMWSKRRYAMNTLIGSVSGAVTPLIGWSAIDSAVHIVPIMLFVLIFIWQMPHTFAIAMRKCDEYRLAKVAMLPVVRGFKVTKQQMVVFIALLLPLPFFLTASLGMTFMIVATILNVAWLAMSIYGFYTKNDMAWSRIMFLYSVNYLTILFVMMVVITLPIFH
ncbi:protoheme IX farnesyltransferase [Salipaludibacillus keqinensis]|uniref:Protoheme IX farnesyltransferase n=1 Tax=Salipaludibacillus keqinensis TaxID=2045207 RepID=A0A323TCB5_9BACI|nr:heme o synthase [Salipaludibacillus keqinensis]PYZ92286.1 protoheme IX farnesyltransferase [Salipaludibacillus keqinensis]